MSSMQIFADLESILSVVEDGEYEDASAMMSSLRHRLPIGHRLEWQLKSCHDAIKTMPYPDKVVRIQSILDTLCPLR